MQPDQNQEPNPNLPQQADISSTQPTSQTTLKAGRADDSTKVIQPLSPNLSTNPEPTASNTPSVVPSETPVVNTPLPANNPQQLSSSPSSIYPDPQTGFVSSKSSPISQASIENEEKQHKKHKRLILSLTCLVVIVLAGAGGFYYWYSQQDHSVYSKLTTESYNQNGIDFSFEYPSILQSNPSIATQKKYAPFTYSYYIDNNAQAVVFASYLSIGSILQQLNLTPTQFISQVRADSGSFITATNSKSAFAGCNNTILTSSGQTDAVCINNSVGKNNVTYTNIRVVGATSSNQYTLFLDMLPSVLSSHQKVWQKVEKSFSYQ